VAPPGIAFTIEKGGLGTSLVNALAHQLDARVESTGSFDGTRVSIMRTTFTSRFPEAA
jgi:chemotaxis protein methyltransferase CheR